MMKRARALSRQPSAGPSRRANARKRVSVDQEIIELTDSDSEDEQFGLPHQKRQKLARTYGQAIDLTFVEVSSSVSEQDSSVHSDAKDAKVQGEARREKGKEKALTDVTNDQAIHSFQPNPIQIDGPVVVNEVVQVAPTDPLDLYLSQVLEVVPDVQPDHVRSLLIEHQASYGTDVVATVIHLLFEQPYPKIERNKGKRKQDVDDDSGKYPAKSATKDYGSKDRAFEGGEHYAGISLNQLTIDFPRIPVPHIRQTLQSNNSLYAPTHLMLREQLKQNPTPFKVKTTATRPTGKGKQHDAEFERELAWLLQTLNDRTIQNGNTSQQADEDSDDGECEDGIECGCCFSTYAFDKMVQCPDAHLFCKGCMRSFVENQLGQHDPNITCMDQSGCKLAFAYAELKRILSPKLLELYERVKQTKEIEAAELDGLEECPFCEYKVVIENPEEKLFHCEREECGAVSCRACKKLDHLPRSCKEAEEDKGLNARHRIEEAMTEALMRTCPKCKKGFIKEAGCNKMSCPNCRTLSCYICRQVVKGYEHFDTRPPGSHRKQGSSSMQKCLLWDPVEERHDREVAEAREKAIEEAKKAHPEVDKKELEVELPKTAVVVNARVGQGVQGRGVLPAMAHLMPGMPQLGGVPVMQRFGININFQFDPVLQGVQRLFNPFGQPMPPHDQAALQNEREAIQRRNEEMRRQVAERQENIRQQFEAQRQQRAGQLREYQGRWVEAMGRARIAGQQGAAGQPMMPPWPGGMFVPLAAPIFQMDAVPAMQPQQQQQQPRPRRAAARYGAAEAPAPKVELLPAPPRAGGRYGAAQAPVPKVEPPQQAPPRARGRYTNALVSAPKVEPQLPLLRTGGRYGAAQAAVPKVEPPQPRRTRGRYSTTPVPMPKTEPTPPVLRAGGRYRATQAHTSVAASTSKS